MRGGKDISLPSQFICVSKVIFIKLVVYNMQGLLNYLLIKTEKITENLGLYRSQLSVTGPFLRGQPDI